MQLTTAEADGSALTIETAELTVQLNQARRQAQDAALGAVKSASVTDLPAATCRRLR